MLVHNDGEQGKPAPPRAERAEAEIKVTDRRMFTPAGELREEFRDLENAPPPRPEAPRPAGAAAPAPGPQAGAGTAAGAAAPGRDRPSPAGAPAGGAPGAPPRPEPARPAEAAPPGGGPGFLDLVGMLVESAAVYLGDARLPDGSAVEDLDLARFHVDLLDVLRRKTAGNLTAQESAALDDVLYRLRMRYVQKRG